MKYAQTVNLVNEILAQYSMRLTLRQIYYRLVADYGLPNKRSSYNQLSSQLVKAREKGEINENRIEDRTREFLGGDEGWIDPQFFLDTIKDSFLNYWRNYKRRMWTSQEKFVVVWVEKDALSRVVSNVADKYRVITAPSKGYASYTYIKEAIAKIPRNKKIIILHFADHDPSGYDLTRDLEDRFARYTSQPITIERVALTFQQVKDYDLVPNPTKTSDTRSRQYIAEYGRNCWELDAIEPTELQWLVKNSIDNHLNLDKWNEDLLLEEQERAQLEEKFAVWAELLSEAQT